MGIDVDGNNKIQVKFNLMMVNSNPLQIIMTKPGIAMLYSSLKFDFPIKSNISRFLFKSNWNQNIYMPENTF